MFSGDAYSHEDHTSAKNLVQMAFKFQRSTDATGLALGITPWLRHLTHEKFGLRQMRISNGEMLDSLQVCCICRNFSHSYNSHCSWTDFQWFVWNPAPSFQ